MKDILEYNPDTGIFIWLRTKTNAKKGDEAGYIDVHGYRRICIDDVKYYAHRLAWWFIYNEWPTHVIDHINRIRSDNKIVNLRAVTQKENGYNRGLNINNSSGFKGVSFDRRRSNWCAYIHMSGKKIYLGSFQNKNAAIEARKQAEVEYGI